MYMYAKSREAKQIYSHLSHDSETLQTGYIKRSGIKTCPDIITNLLSYLIKCTDSRDITVQASRLIGAFRSQRSVQNHLLLSGRCHHGRCHDCGVCVEDDIRIAVSQFSVSHMSHFIHCIILTTASEEPRLYDGANRRHRSFLCFVHFRRRVGLYFPNSASTN